MNSAEEQVLRFPGANASGEARETAEAGEDARLLAAVAREDQEALAALYRRRAPLLYSVLVRMLGNLTEAQEVMQDTFIQIWRRAGRYDPARSAPAAWMIMLARGLALDRLRARARQAARQADYTENLPGLALKSPETGRSSEQSDLAAACAAALQRLPEPQSNAIQLAFFRGLTQEEIARAERQPLGTIKARIRRGLLAMRQTLKDYRD